MPEPIPADDWKEDMEREIAEEEFKVAQIMEKYEAFKEEYKKAENEGRKIPVGRIFGYNFNMYNVDYATKFHLRWSNNIEMWCNKRVDFDPADPKDWDFNPTSNSRRVCAKAGPLGLSTAKIRFT